MRTYTMDVETAELLKNSGTNASELINKLVQEFFKYGETDDPKALMRRKQEFEEEIEIYNKRLEHINNKLITLKHSEERKKLDLDYQKKVKEYTAKVDVLNKMWHDNEISEEEYWGMVDKLKEEEPKKYDG